MSDVALALRQVRYTNKAFWRNPASAFFTFAFPLMFLVIFTALFTNLAVNVTFTRDAGILKRIRGTPLPGWAYMFGRIVHAILVAFMLVIIVTAFGAAFYHARVPSRTLPAFIVTIILGAACFSALGLAMTAAIPNADASPAIVN